MLYYFGKLEHGQMICLSQWHVSQAQALRLGIWTAEADRDILDSDCSQPVQYWNIMWVRNKSLFKTAEIWGLFDTMA